MSRVSGLLQILGFFSLKPQCMTAFCDRRYSLRNPQSGVYHSGMDIVCDKQYVNVMYQKHAT